MNPSRSMFSIASIFTKDYASQILVHPFDLVLVIMSLKFQKAVLLFH
jgi:hypothetical protein